MAKAAEVILYEEDGWSDETISDVIARKKTIKEYAFILHDKDIDEETGEPKKPHYHLYLSFGSSNVTFNYIALWFHTSTQSVERVKGGKYAVLRYYTHAGHPEKYQYNVADIVANFDVVKYLSSKGQKQKLDEIIRQCSDGIITRLNYTAFIDPVTYAKHKTQIERAWEYHDDAFYAENGADREISVFWLFGSSGLGKTTLAKMAAAKLREDLYIASQGKHPFDQYKSQRICLLDDLRPDCPFSLVDLLQILDNHTSREIGARYSNKLPFFNYVFITSVMSPTDFYRAYNQPSEEDTQLYRRITEVWEIRNDQILISAYSKENGFVQKKSMENPVPGYLLDREKTTKNNNVSKLLEDYLDKQLPIEDVFEEQTAGSEQPVSN